MLNIDTSLNKQWEVIWYSWRFLSPLNLLLLPWLDWNLPRDFLCDATESWPDHRTWQATHKSKFNGNISFLVKHDILAMHFLFYVKMLLIILPLHNRLMLISLERWHVHKMRSNVTYWTWYNRIHEKIWHVF